MSIKLEKGTIHDFLEERKWLLQLAGHGKSRNLAYSAYIGMIYLFLLYLLSMAVAAEFVIAGDKELMVHAFHVCLLLIYSAWVLTTRIITNKSLLKTSDILKSGIYHYEEEELNEDELKIRKEGVELVKKRSNTLAAIFCASGISNTFLFPVSQIFLMSSEQNDNVHINPYLPHPFYMPFNTKTFIGYAAGYFLNALISVYVYSLVICMNNIFISCTVQLRAHLQILNHSLQNIHCRAYIRCKKRGIIHLNEVSDENLFNQPEFQDCMYKCLRANVMHHQALLRLKDTFHGYVGGTLLNVVAVASFIFAAHLYLIMENPPLNVLINYVITLTAELSYPLYLCFYGEEIFEESLNVFESLYSTPWMNCDKRFKRMLCICLSYCKQPLRVNTVIFNVTASLQTYGSSISGMYKIANLMRK